jgi:repressor LexA
MLNPRSQSIVEFIRDYPHPYAPTVREIAKGVGLNSSATVQYHLNRLIKLGYISREPNSARTIQLLKDKV